VPEVEVALGALRPRRRTETGAAALEFALVMPVLLLLIFGLIQWGLYFWAYQGGADAARQAARTSATGQWATCSTFRTNTRSAIGNLATNSATVTRSYTPGPTNATGTVQAGDYVTVSVSFQTTNLNFPFVPFVHDGVVTQTAKARVEYAETQPETCS
jgi:Flp pilus assembly protein TadG